MSPIFLLDKAKVKQSFSTASTTYDGFAQLQRNIGKALLEACPVKNANDILLDLGCGTGFLTNELLRSAPHPKTLIALDMAWPMLQQARSKLAKQDKVQYLCADAERVPIADQSMDGVFSNLALQWCRNPDALFADIKRIIKPGGQLVFSTFGPQTLHELKNAWAEVDDYCHVNEFYSELQLKYSLELTGFRDVQIATKSYRPTYGSVLELMHELKSIGAHNVMSGRNKKMTTPTQLQNMLMAYEKYRFDNRIPATFVAILVSAKV